MGKEDLDCRDRYHEYQSKASNHPDKFPAKCYDYQGPYKSQAINISIDGRVHGSTKGSVNQ